MPATIGFVTSNTEKPAPPLPYGMNNNVRQLLEDSNSPLELYPLINTS